MVKKRKNKTKKSMDKKEKKSTVDHIISFISRKDFITVIVGLCASLYPIINTVYKKIYQQKCEKFYGIPGKYFDSNVDNEILNLCCFIIFLLISVVPLLMKNYYKKRENSSKRDFVDIVFISIIFGVEIGLFNAFNLIEIMEQTYKMNEFFRSINNWIINNIALIVAMVVVLGSISVLGITLIDNIRSIKWKWIKNVVCAIMTVSLVASVLVMVYGTIFKFSIWIEDKTKYEFVTYDEEYVILSSYNDKNLIVPFEIDENEQYVFKTGQYLFGERCEGMYQYRDIKYSPRIDLNIKR